MGSLKYIERIERMDQLIHRANTGTAEEFSHKLGVSRSTLMEDLKEIREKRVVIIYNKKLRSYCYEGNCRIVIEFRGDS